MRRMERRWGREERRKDKGRKMESEKRVKRGKGKEREIASDREGSRQ